MTAKELFSSIKDKPVSFFSISSKYKQVNSDLSLKSHPHNDITDIENELIDRFVFVNKIFEDTNGKIAKRPKKGDLLLGFLYSNQVNPKIYF